jgi:hypothetical protein
MQGFSRSIEAVETSTGDATIYPFIRRTSIKEA